MTRDDGFTLVEVLVALAILTAAVATIVAALGTAAGTADRHRKQTQDELAVRSWAEAIAASSLFTCTATSYGATTLGVTIPVGYTATTPLVTTLAGGACTTAGFASLKVTIGVQSTDSRAVTSLDVVKYEP